MSIPLSNFVNNYSEGNHKIKCKKRHDDNKFQSCRIRYKYCDCFLEYPNFKYYLIENKGFSRNKTNEQKFDEKSKEEPFCTCKISNHDNEKFTLLLLKDIYPCEFMNDWEKFNETSLPK